MRVRMKEIMSGPQGTVRAGEVTEVPDAIGKQLIENRFAEAVPETAAEDLAGAETAAQPKPRKKPKPPAKKSSTKGGKKPKPPAKKASAKGEGEKGGEPEKS